MISVCCVLKSGGDFLPEHVETLRDSIKRNATVPYRFVVVTDVLASKFSSQIEVIKLRHDLPGWWSKMELFTPENRAELGPTLYFDLDTAICGNIDDLLNYATPSPRGDEAPFTILQDFYRPWGYGSGVMFIPATVGEFVWDRFNARAGKWPDDLRGDQDFLEHHIPDAVRWQKVRPGLIYSFKPVPIGEGLNALPAGARVICFHGFPRPWQLSDNHWVRQYWKRDPVYSYDDFVGNEGVMAL